MDDVRQISQEELPTEIPDSQEAKDPYVSRASHQSTLEHPGNSFVTISSESLDDELDNVLGTGEPEGVSSMVFLLSSFEHHCVTINKASQLHPQQGICDTNVLIVKTSNQLGFNTNGYTPAEAFGVLSDDGMDENPTQPATQPFFDPRRRETKSALTLRDEEDVLCILTPSSRRAHDAVDLVASTTPQHILQNFLAESTPEAAWQDSQHHTTDKTSEGDSRPAKDIALRMSSRIHDPCMGFVFGRNIHRCDLLLSETVKTEQKISNIHFRIFVNRHGVLMVEDMSKNGTTIDNVLLRSAKSDAQKPTPSMNTITGGSTITVPPQSQQSKPNDEEIRFTVRMPSRDQGQANYNARLEAYVEYIGQAERRAAVALNAGGRVPPPLPVCSVQLSSISPHNLT